MINETALKDLIERERRHIEKLDIGSDEYVKCMERLMELERLVSEFEKIEIEKEQSRKSRHMGTAIEWAKIVTNIVMPLIGLIAIIAAERDITFTGAFRDVTKCFLPKRI